MKKTIQAIINYLDAETGGKHFVGDCGSDFDKVDRCRDAQGDTCKPCKVAFYKWERNRLNLERINKAFKEEV